jgi:hypothetical protein
MKKETESETLDADEFYEIIASNPTCFEDFVGMPNTPETRQKLHEFIKKKFREQMIELAAVQPMSRSAGSIFTVNAKYSDEYMQELNLSAKHE